MNMPLHQRSQGAVLQDYLEILWRRKWFLVIPLALGLGLGGIACFLIPPTYRSSTLILVEPQKVPSSYVNPTVTGTVDDRLRTISQQIMSRTNLSKIVKEYSLYKPEEPVNTPQDGWIDKGKEKVKQVLVNVGLMPKNVAVSPNQDEVPEDIINRMRKDIEVKVTGKEAFSVAYMGRDPSVVMRVTNTLALLFIEENLKVRERQAEGTSEFLESQLGEVEKELQRQEHNLRDFQQQHRGALPAQLDANLRTLDRLQQELSSVNDLMKSTEIALSDERKALEERKVQAAEASAQTPVTATAPQSSQPVAPKAPPINPRLEALKQELGRLRATFNENYPDITSIKKQIEELEAAVVPEPPTPPSAPVQPPSTAKPAPTVVNPATRVTHTARANNIEQLERELVVLRSRREKAIAQIQKLEEHVNSTPANEEKLTELTRDYGMSLKNYQALLDKRMQAKISENLEKKQKGEQFRILDPANFPTRPSDPNPPVIVGIGGALGGGLGFGLILLFNFFNPALRKAEEIYGTFGVPVLVTIPRYHLDVVKDHHLVVLQEADSFVAEQYRLLYAKISDLTRERGHKIFAVTSAVQSEGKTVTALNLAVVMARDFGKKTLVLEGDFRRPTIPLYLKVDLEEGLVDILSSKADLQSTMVPVANTLVPFADENLAILPAVRRTQSSTSLLSSPRMRDLFEMLREQYDCILIDAPPILPLSDMNIFEEVVDGVLVVVRAEKTTKDAVANALNTLGVAKVLGIVLNDVREPSFPYYRYNYRYDYKPDTK